MKFSHQLFTLSFILITFNKNDQLKTKFRILSKVEALFTLGALLFLLGCQAPEKSPTATPAQVFHLDTSFQFEHFIPADEPQLVFIFDQLKAAKASVSETKEVTISEKQTIYGYDREALRSIRTIHHPLDQEITTEFVILSSHDWCCSVHQTNLNASNNEGTQHYYFFTENTLQYAFVSQLKNTDKIYTNLTNNPFTLLAAERYTRLFLEELKTKKGLK